MQFVLVITPTSGQLIYKKKHFVFLILDSRDNKRDGS